MPLTAVTRLVGFRSAKFVWRGQASVSWPLVPAINRKIHLLPPLDQADVTTSDRETEALIARARQHRHDEAYGGREIPDLALLALLQHHGAATPLVDVTSDPMVALYFACQPAEENGASTHGVLLAVDVRSTPSHNLPARAITFDVDEGGTWAEVQKRLADEGSPIGLYTPPPITERIRVQRGRFIFGPAMKGLSHTTLSLPNQPGWNNAKLKRLFAVREENARAGGVSIPPLVAILVRAQHKAHIREVLEGTYGITAETLFPDLSGFAVAHGVTGTPLVTRVPSTGSGWAPSRAPTRRKRSRLSPSPGLSSPDGSRNI